MLKLKLTFKGTSGVLKLNVPASSSAQICASQRNNAVGWNSYAKIYEVERDCCDSDGPSSPKNIQPVFEIRDLSCRTRVESTDQRLSRLFFLSNQSTLKQTSKKKVVVC